MEYPSDVKPVFSNMVTIQHTDEHFILIFSQIFVPISVDGKPKGSGKAVVKAVVYLAPAQAKKLLNVLAANVANYEGQFGRIKLLGNKSVSDKASVYRR